MLHTATVTWITWPNFGSYLQAYALQQVIKGLGYDNKIIDDGRVVSPTYQGYPKYKEYSFKKKLRHKIALVLHLHSRQDNLSHDSYWKFIKFRDSFLDIDNDYRTFEELGKKYDVYIAGSDQIWYPDKEIFKPFYYLDFTSRKKVSYAASIGVKTYPEEYKEKVKTLLSSFSHISVREARGAELLKGFLNREVHVDLDPTLLLDGSKWKEIMSDHAVTHKKYVLCYLLTANQSYFEFARDFATKRNLKLVFFNVIPEVESYADKVIAAGPREFIRAINDAEYVLTDSYHGTVFSILLHKTFLTFKRFHQGDNRNQNSRIENLFKILDIKDYFVDVQDLSKCKLESLDYAKIEELLDKEKLKSLSYIKNIL